jgi:hypothetical protein
MAWRWTFRSPQRAWLSGMSCRVSSLTLGCADLSPGHWASTRRSYASGPTLRRTLLATEVPSTDGQRADVSRLRPDPASPAHVRVRCLAHCTTVHRLSPNQRPARAPGAVGNCRRHCSAHDHRRASATSDDPHSPCHNSPYRRIRRMPNHQVLEVLRQGTQTWNDWRAGGRAGRSSLLG